jgi:hypothetical protein
LKTPPTPIRHRWALVVGAILALAAGLALFGLAGRGQPLPVVLSQPTAMFLGGCYLAGFIVLLVAWREAAWGGAAAIGPGVFAATSLTLAVTALEFGRFNWTGAGPASEVAAYVFLAAVVVAPAGWLYLVFANDFGWVADPPGRPPLPAPLLALVAVQSMLLLAAGAGLFVSPDAMPWPWHLGSPGDRLAGAWLVAFALTGVAVLVERDEGRNRAPFAGCLALALLQLAAAVVNLRQFHLSPGAVAYWVFLASLLLSGTAGLRRGVRDPRPRAAPLVR